MLGFFGRAEEFADAVGAGVEALGQAPRERFGIVEDADQRCTLISRDHLMICVLR